MRRRVLVSTLLACGALVLGPLASPGHAAVSTTLSDVATPAPGQVTGTVTSDAAYVRVRLVASGGGALDGGVQQVPTDTRSVPFTMPTWGFPDASQISVSTCTDADPSTCTYALSEAFTPSDVPPAVTWPTDTTIGPADLPYLVTVDDPDAGPSAGRLRILQSNGLASPTWMQPGVATEVVPGGEGGTTLSVERCADAGSPCRSYPALAHGISVHTRVETVLESRWPEDIVAPDDTTAPDLKLSYSVWGVEPVDLHVTITDTDTGTVVDGFGGDFVGLRPNRWGTTDVALNLTGLPSGTYRVGGMASADLADYGHLEGALDAEWFTVDATPPVIRTLRASSTTLYPAKDGYQDSVRFTYSIADENLGFLRLTILDRAGTVVRTLDSDDSWDSGEMSWNGKEKGGGVAPSGKYTVRATAFDSLGNKSAETRTLPLTISSKRLVQRTFTKTVSARGSMVSKHVGRCSTLSTPSSHGWRGSIGLNGGTRCSGGVKATVVSTVHATKLPAAVRYGALYVSAYGGAGHSNPRSLAYLTYYHQEKGWRQYRRLGSNVGEHAGAGVSGAPYIFDDHSFAWGVYTAAPARYDVKSFTVHLTYWALV